MLDKYKITNTIYLDPPKEFSNENLFQDFQLELNNFKTQIMNDIKNSNNNTYYKFGDGDYYFLKKDPKGSAKPGRRALKKPYYLINHKKFVEGSKQNNFYTSQIQTMHKNMFRELFGKPSDFPSEYIYGLVANKWFFNNINQNIGLIGADKKIELIHNLMEHNQYQEYIGVQKFTDYITIPQRFACDNLKKTIKTTKKQLLNSESKVFFVGVGHVKSGLLHELKNIKKAIYIDIGVGIDALAGIVNLTRPYFGQWENLPLKRKSINVAFKNYSDKELSIPTSSFLAIKSG